MTPLQKKRQIQRAVKSYFRNEATNKAFTIIDNLISTAKVEELEEQNDKIFKQTIKKVIR